MKTKSYELFLHYKQGDDLASFLRDNKDNAKAFSEWAVHFAHCRDVCNKVAEAIKGQDIEVRADVHFIAFYPNTKEATRVLEFLEKENLVTSSVTIDDDE